MPCLGLLGCGNIGDIIARHAPRFPFVAVFDRHPERTREIAAHLNAEACGNFNDFLASDFDIVVEAASVQSLHDHAEALLASGKDLITLSVGAFAEREFRQRLTNQAGRLGRLGRLGEREHLGGHPLRGDHHPHHETGTGRRQEPREGRRGGNSPSSGLRRAKTDP